MTTTNNNSRGRKSSKWYNSTKGDKVENIIATDNKQTIVALQSASSRKNSSKRGATQNININQIIKQESEINSNLLLNTKKQPQSETKKDAAAANILTVKNGQKSFKKK